MSYRHQSTESVLPDLQYLLCHCAVLKTFSTDIVFNFKTYNENLKCGNCGLLLTIGMWVNVVKASSTTPDLVMTDNGEGILFKKNGVFVAEHQL